MMHRLLLALTGLVLVVGSTAFAQESVLESAPIPTDAESLEDPSDGAFTPEAPPEKGSYSVKDALKDAPAFFKDTTAKVNLRSFYFARQDGADSSGNDKEKISWALGGSAAIKSGKLMDVFSVGAEVFTSQRLYGPEDKDGALVLETGQDSYTVLGVANPRFDYEGHALSLYRQRLDLPYVNNQENRMTPNTFENYSYAYLGSGEKPFVQFAAGYLDKIKTRNAVSFVSMSEAAGVKGADRGMPWAGARIRPLESVKISAVDYVGIDFLNFFYTDAEYTVNFCEDWSSKSSVQASTQQSIGEDLLTGSNVSAAMWGAQEAISYKKFLARAAITVDDEGMVMRSPYGSYPGYNSAIVEDFNRAGEIAWKLGVSYDFSGVGLEGVSAYLDFIQGNGAVDENHNDLNDKNETDLNLDYRIQDGALKGFWLRLRGGWVHEESVGTTQDYRVILNYDIPII